MLIFSRDNRVDARNYVSQYCKSGELMELCQFSTLFQRELVRVVNAHLNTCMDHFTQDPDYRGRGTSDGVFQNHSYFTCNNNCGLFVSLEKLWFERKSVGIQGELQLASQLTNLYHVQLHPSTWINLVDHTISKNLPQSQYHLEAVQL